MPDDTTHHTKPHHSPWRRGSRENTPQTRPTRTRAATTSQPTTYSSPPTISCSHHHNGKNNPKTLTNSNKLFQITHSPTDRTNERTTGHHSLRSNPGRLTSYRIPRSMTRLSVRLVCLWGRGRGGRAHKTLATERNPRARDREKMGE
jgi:hypothetical protein